MKKYQVTLYYHTYVDVIVDAKDEKDAVIQGYLEAGDSRYDKLLLRHLQADGDPDVTEYTEEE